MKKEKQQTVNLKILLYQFDYFPLSFPASNTFAIKAVLGVIYCLIFLYSIQLSKHKKQKTERSLRINKWIINLHAVVIK